MAKTTFVATAAQTKAITAVFNKLNSLTDQVKKLEAQLLKNGSAPTKTGRTAKVAKKVKPTKIKASKADKSSPKVNIITTRGFKKGHKKGMANHLALS